MGPARISEREKQPPGNDRAAAARYIAAMIGGLAAMARQHEFEALAYLLDMGRLEAESTVQRLDS